MERKHLSTSFLIRRTNVDKFIEASCSPDCCVNFFWLISCGLRRLRPGIPIERGHAFRSKAATCSVEGGRGIVAGMIS
jgi:hypothetical protein